MKVLVACEYSGAVRDAFIAAGHDAMSCDLLPSDSMVKAPHYQGNVFDLFPVVDGRRTNPHDFFLMVAHPPCTYLCSSGLHWNTRRPGRAMQTAAALAFVMDLMALPVAMIAIENPVGCISSKIRKPEQIIQPWQFGHNASKGTCLWLKNLPNLTPTNVLTKPESGRWANQTPSGQNNLGPSADRWKVRSATYSGIAEAMATQWGSISPWYIRRTDLIPTGGTK